MRIRPVGEITKFEVLEGVAFVVLVCAFQFAGRKAGFRFAGIELAAWSVWVLVVRRVPYGWEGHDPSGHITGGLAILTGVVFFALGIAMIVWPQFIAMLFGGSES